MPPFSGDTGRASQLLQPLPCVLLGRVRSGRPDHWGSRLRQVWLEETADLASSPGQLFTGEFRHAASIDEVVDPVGGHDPDVGCEKVELSGSNADQTLLPHAFQDDPGLTFRPQGRRPYLERLEILRGPQGTLFGRNTSAGALSITTKRPDLNDYEGFANVSVGNFDFVGVQAGFNAPVVTDQLGIRLPTPSPAAAAPTSARSGPSTGTRPTRARASRGFPTSS